jgi:acyl carrier protein
MTREIGQIEEIVFEYVKNNTNTDISKITEETLLFREGIFDSMGFILLIDFIQAQFGIETSDNDLVEENFESVNAISNFIQRKS